MSHPADPQVATGRISEAEALYRRRLEGRAPVLGPTRADALVSLERLASALALLGRRAEAETLCGRALDGGWRCGVLWDP